jgi:hypothetical protein
LACADSYPTKANRFRIRIKQRNNYYETSQQMKTIDAEIRAANADDPGNPGKTHTVVAYRYDMTIRANRLRLTGWDQKKHGTGDRGGRIKTTNRYLTLEFNLEALEDIFEYAISKGLFQPKAVKRLASAQLHVDAALKQLGYVRRPKKESAKP